MTVNLVENSTLCQFLYQVQVTVRAELIQLRRVKARFLEDMIGG